MEDSFRSLSPQHNKYHYNDNESSVKDMSHVVEKFSRFKRAVNVMKLKVVQLEHGRYFADEEVVKKALVVLFNAFLARKPKYSTIWNSKDVAV